MGHLIYTTSSFVHHFKSTGEFKLELQSGNAQFGSKLAVFVPWYLIIGWMTLENTRAPLLCHIKLCVSFESHEWIRTEVTVRKRSILVNSCNKSILRPCRWKEIHAFNENYYIKIIRDLVKQNDPVGPTHDCDFLITHWHIILNIVLKVYRGKQVSCCLLNRVLNLYYSSEIDYSYFRTLQIPQYNHSVCVHTASFIP